MFLEPFRSSKKTTEKGKSMNDTFRIALVARMKHGVLYEAIKKRGWNNKRAAEFLGISQSKISAIINLMERPPFIFSKVKTPEYRKRARELTEKLMELTWLAVDDIFPEEFRTNEFLSRPKTIEGVRDIPKQILLGAVPTPQMLPAPDEELLQKEAYQELIEMVEELPPEQRSAVRGLYFEGKTTRKLSQENRVGETAVRASALKGLRYLEERIGHRKRIEDENPRVDLKTIKGRVKL